MTKNAIHLVATNVRSGTSSWFRGTAHIGIQAVVNRVNGEGGICGRLLDLRLMDQTKPSPQTTAFAVVAPLAFQSELDRAGIPAVGGWGGAKEHYTSRWAWPVGPPSVTLGRVMARHAHGAGARSFGVVFDDDPSGTEGAVAFKEYVRALTGSDPRAYVGLPPDKGSYAIEAKAFNEACGSAGCDFVAMLLTPGSAATYISSQTESGGKKQGFGTKLTSGPPALFSERFARDCAKYCDDMLLWTGFTPPIGEHAALPDVARYVDEVQRIDPSVDVTNVFLESAYVGTEVLVQALRQVGNDLTRARLQQALDDLTFRSSLVTDLRWGPIVPQQRVANNAARGFRIETASGSFVGFHDAGTGWIRDPQPGNFPG